MGGKLTTDIYASNTPFISPPSLCIRLLEELLEKSILRRWRVVVVPEPTLVKSHGCHLTKVAYDWV